MKPELFRQTGIWEYPRINHIVEINDKYINDIIKRKKNSTSIYEKYLGSVDGKAAIRTADALYGIKKLNKKYINLKREKISLNKIIRTFIFEKLSWFFAKTGLLYKWHFPRSAYVEIRDIPYMKQNRLISK